jgi:hypothetical protein
MPVTFGDQAGPPAGLLSTAASEQIPVHTSKGQRAAHRPGINDKTTPGKGTWPA